MNLFTTAGSKFPVSNCQTSSSRGKRNSRRFSIMKGLGGMQMSRWAGKLFWIVKEVHGICSPPHGCLLFTSNQHPFIHAHAAFVVCVVENYLVDITYICTLNIVSGNKWQELTPRLIYSTCDFICLLECSVLLSIISYNCD